MVSFWISSDRGHERFLVVYLRRVHKAFLATTQMSAAFAAPSTAASPIP